MSRLNPVGAIPRDTPPRQRGPLPMSAATYPLSRAGQRTHAWADVLQGARAFHLWGAPPLTDAAQHFRRTIIGPYIPTLNRGLTIATIGLLFGRLIDLRAERYLPHLIVGLIVWLLIQSVVRDGCRAFSRAAPLIATAGLPISIHVYRCVWQAFIAFGFNFTLLAGAAAAFQFLPGWSALLAIPGLLLLFFNSLWIALVLACVCLRFRFLIGIVKRTLRIVFLLTPIIWMPHQFPTQYAFVQANPLHHALEVVREPLIGGRPEPVSWAILAGIAVIGWFAAIRVYARCRAQIALLV